MAATGTSPGWRPWRPLSPCWRLTPRLEQWLILSLIISSQSDNAMWYPQGTRNPVKLPKGNSCVPSQNGMRWFFWLFLERVACSVTWLSAPDSAQLCPVLQLCSGGCGSGASSCSSKLMPKSLFKLHEGSYSFLRAFSGFDNSNLFHCHSVILWRMIFHWHV